MLIKLIAASLLVLALSTKAISASFDYIAPSNVYFNQSELGTGIGSPFWGLLIATNSDLSLKDLQKAVINTSIDNQDLTFSQSGEFMNLHIYAPLFQGEVAGYSSSGPVTDSSILLSLLNPDETLKYASGQIQGQSILFADNWLGTANVDYEIIIGNQHVEFTTKLHFIESLPNNLWVEVTDGVRLTSTTISSVPLPPPFWLLGSGMLALISFIKRKNA